MSKILWVPGALAALVACTACSGGNSVTGGDGGSASDGGKSDTSTGTVDGGAGDSSMGGPDSTIPSDSGMGDAGDGGIMDSGGGTMDSGTADSGHDSGTPHGDSGGPDSGEADSGGHDGATTDAGTMDTGMADTSTADTGSPMPEGGSGCGIPNGVYQATQVTCNGGAPLDFTGITWIANYQNGAMSSFTFTVLGCSQMEMGPSSCTNGVLEVDDTSTSCSPANCAPFGPSGCSDAIGAFYWGVSQVTPTTFMLTSMNEPDGGPTPIQTCTGEAMSNPIQILWTKM